MNPTQKQFSLNRRASRKQIPISNVHASVDGPAWVEAQPDHLSVRMTGHRIVIEKDRLLLDKAEVAKVPADAKKFDVVVAEGILTVTAEGVEILKTTLK